MLVCDTFSEHDWPNENPTEALGVKPLKIGEEAIMNRTGAITKVWPYFHRYIADINNICANPYLNYEIPKQVHHGYTIDISPFLQFQFWKHVYYLTDDSAPNSRKTPDIG